VLNTSNCFVFGNTASGNALSVQQLGAGNVASFRTTTGATALFINPSGYVGVGTTSPGYILEVSNSTASTSTSFLGLTNPYVFGFNTGLNIGSSIVYSSRWQGDGGSGVVEMCKIDGRKENSANYGDSYLAFQTRYETNRGLGGAGTLAEKMRITGAGNVGIGTASPTDPLTVQALNTQATFADLSQTTPNSKKFSILYQNLGGVGNMYWSTFLGKSLSTDGTNFTIHSDGSNRGMSAIELGYFGVNFYSNVQGVSTTDQTGITPTALQASRVMTIQGVNGSTGRVGIGTPSPGYTLQVNGSIGMVGGTTIPVTLPAIGSQTSYGITLAASGTWYTIISDARINATITGAIGQSDLTATIFIATLYASGGANASMTLVTGSATNIRVSGTALQFNAVSGLYGLTCNFTLLRHN
jgi:hypothetical protein